jgi:mono/diheme cytochrome c family protein
MFLAVVVLTALVAVACAHISTRPEAQILTAESRNATVSGDPARGGAVYATECAACHGANGQGGFGPSLVDSAVAQSYPRTVEQVTKGQGAMPAFADVLSDEDISNVAAYVHDVVAVSQTRPSLPDVGTLPPTVTSVAQLGVPPGIDASAGADTYVQECASCHGDHGQGTTVGPPLTRPISFDDVLRAILAGRPGMPSYKLLLPSARFDELVAYVVKTFMEPVLQPDGGSGAASGAPSGATEG